ncbi:MAG: polyphosphate:AMP phosphotransferase [Proteobacteria bacterium]|nr:polyphosphate:AMP phosphotransferase [Pseudomonadota bacterium]MDA0983492.1 polyphosphate:AMP phosphotransferase [Pseudomonadota bacterium]
MFDSANLEHKVSKAAYAREEPKLRRSLLDAQYELIKDGRFPVLVLIAGVEGTGKSETANLFSEWMDARHLHTHAFPDPSDEERERPPMWRYWRALPPRGRVGVFFGAWHTHPIINRVLGISGPAEFGRSVDRILRHERMLCDEGVLLLKYWFHLSEKQQKRRLHKLESDPVTRWRVTPLEWKYFKLYGKFMEVCEPFLHRTSTGEAPWIIVPSADKRYRSLAVGRHMLAAIRERLEDKPAKKQPDRNPPLLDTPDNLNVIRALKLDQPMTRPEYDKALEKWQGRLSVLTRHPSFRKYSVVAVFEGNDAAGKGGAIRRLTRALDARVYRTLSVAAPTEEERAQPYLWRFWRHLPRRGRVLIFDRSWYGRVLVERVEGFCPESDWMRAYGEISEFEKQLLDNRVVLVKFWLAVSKDEQLRRFKEREKISFKQFKITEEDWRNRKKWDKYESAICDMVERTSSTSAPWTLVEANNKLHARVKVLKTVVKAIEKALG